jgi:uncharacterized membrane-anchored protein
MTSFLRRIFILQLALVACVSSAPAQDTAPKPADAAPASRSEQLAKLGVKVQEGPAVAKLGKVAELKLPAGFAFVGPDSLDKFFELTHNFRGGNEVGVVLSPEDWMLFFEYDDIGYVKDDEKNDLNPEKLYKTLAEGTDAGNAQRRSKGWAELKLQGWATPPHYDEKTNNLKWAFKLSSSSDQHQSIGINESIRLLGRGGVMNVTLVTGTEGFKQVEAQAERLLADFSYVSGEKYAEFKSGDKIAKYGLAALVVGGAGAVALKTGLLAKFWKPIAAGIAALGVGIAKLWKKIVGKDQV